MSEDREKWNRFNQTGHRFRVKKLRHGLKTTRTQSKTCTWALCPHLVGVFCGEILHWWDDALSNQLTIGGRSLLLDQLRLLAADWSKQAADTQEEISL